MDKQTAIFAAGCFWGVEAAFSHVPGVIDAVSGYTGGTTVNPTYQDVCSHTTGHAEAVEVTYDADVIGYDRLLDVFWQIHDPTTLNRQGPDVGTQYRSAIFVRGDRQRELALAALERESRKHDRPIVTQIVDAGPFYRAEEYHQRYHEKHGGSCAVQS